jgi:hypothetical protein
LWCLLLGWFSFVFHFQTVFSFICAYLAHGLSLIILFSKFHILCVKVISGFLLFLIKLEYLLHPCRFA